jgi:hypothetical protein
MTVSSRYEMRAGAEHPTRYPIYVPTYDRYETPYTISFLQRDRVPFRAVVQDEERLIVLPPGDWNLLKTRCWIMDHAIAEGHERHWQLDDNMRDVRYAWQGDRIPCNAAIGLGACEDFSDRYENVGVSGLNYQMFVTDETRTPYFLNAHVYSCTLVNNSIPYRWRLVLNDDTDLCLQVLAGGWCTVLLNAFVADKIKTMQVGGGNTDRHYQGDGRLEMARVLERAWPGVVKVDRRYGRPQHVIDWKKFDTPLKPKPNYDEIVQEQAERRGQMTLKLGRDLKSDRLRRKAEEWNARE